VRFAAAGVAAIFLATQVGCEPDPGMSPRADLVLDSPPGEAVSITEASESLAEPGQVTLIGRIDAGDLEPFEPGKATFVLSEVPDPEHTGGDPDHADNCPFCKRRLQNAPKAVVRFLGESGEVISEDARQLLGVKEQDVVMVSGSAHFQPDLDTLLVDAETVYVRP
jgi:hypothetical protein